MTLEFPGWGSLRTDAAQLFDSEDSRMLMAELFN
jgi:hypothetical protein